MVVVIPKNSNKKQVQAALKQLKAQKGQSKLSDFYGKLKGRFEDGLKYQNELRNEWD